MAGDTLNISHKQKQKENTQTPTPTPTPTSIPLKTKDITERKSSKNISYRRSKTASREGLRPRSLYGPTTRGVVCDLWFPLVVTDARGTNPSLGAPLGLLGHLNMAHTTPALYIRNIRVLLVIYHMKQVCMCIQKLL